MTLNQHCNLYIASCVPNGGIYRYKLYDDGKLELMDKTELDRPMYMTVSGDKMYIVLRAPFRDSNNSGVVVYDFDENGMLINPSDIQSTYGEVACHIMVDDNDVYCANYISGSVIKLPDTVVKHIGRSINEARQTSPHTHFVGMTPDKKYVCAVDLGVDTIFVYNKDMSLHSRATVPKGHGARHIVFSDDARYMFCANELESTVSVFAYSDGELTLIDTASILPDDFNGKSTAAAIRIRDGLIYVSNRGHNSVSEVEFKDNKLHLIRTIPCGGISPRDFDFINDFMICTNETSDNITVFDCKNNFRQVGDYSVSSPLCVL